MNWGDYRDDVVRNILKDTQTNHNWSDAELLTYANWGLADLTRIAAPLASYALTGAGPSYNFPNDFDALHSVILAEDSQTTVLQPFDLYTTPYLSFTTPDSTSDAGYLLDWPAEGALYVSPSRSSGSYTLIYYRTFADLAVDADEVPTGRRKWLAQALACYIAYCAHLREGVSRAALEQWSQRPDLLVKNPLNAEAAEWLKAYQKLISDHRVRGSA